MAQQERIGRVSTVVFTDSDGLTKIVYHSTPVVSFNDEVIILRHGGWKTTTTKLRMNQTANQFRLGFRVYQDRGLWFVRFAGSDVPFTDGGVITLDRKAVAA